MNCNILRVVFEEVSLDSVTYCEGLVYGEIVIENITYSMEGDQATRQVTRDSTKNPGFQHLEANENIGNGDLDNKETSLTIEVLLVTDESMSFYYEVGID